MICYLAMLTVVAVWDLPAPVCGQGVTLDLMLGEGPVANNTEVFIGDVGEDEDALLCVTDAPMCCDITDGNRRGQWFFPDTTQVGISGGGGDFYRNRGTGVVRLNRRNNATEPTGLYCCEIDSARICAMLLSFAVTVNDNGGAQILEQDYTLTCQVGGGGTTTPTYRWFRDGSLLIGQTSDTLSFSPLNETDSGVYSCEGTRGSMNSESPEITVAPALVPLVVTVIDSGGTLTIGENYTLTCQVTGGRTTTPTYRWFRNGSLLINQISDTLSFSPLRETDSGDYTCEGTRGSMVLESSPGVLITAELPESLSVSITASGSPDEGRSYSLACSIRGDELLALSSLGFRWDKGTIMGISENSTLTLDPVLTGDAGEYTCTISFLSPHLDGRKAETMTMTLVVNSIKVSNIQVTTPTAISLPITWTASGSIDRFEITYNYTINRCSAPPVSSAPIIINNGAMRSYNLTNLNEDSTHTITVRAINTGASATVTEMGVQTLTSAPSGSPGPLNFSDIILTSITVQWTELPCSDHNGEITGYTVEYSSTTPPHPNIITVSGSSNTSLVVDGLLPRTSYTFSVRAQGPAGTSDSATTVMAAATPTEVGLYLNGRILGNNSMVMPKDIGEGSAALYCLTDNVQCCIKLSAAAEMASGLGRWIYPDGTDVGSNSGNFRQIRGLSSVMLSRTSTAMGPTGVYTCIIPDEGNIERTLFITIGQASLTATLSYNSMTHTLNCTSSGGPVDTNGVTWRRDNVVMSSSPYELGQSSMIAPPFIYEHLLTITGSNVEDYIGSFTCAVNSAGSAVTSIPLDIEGTIISGNEALHQVRSVVTLTCSSDLAVQTIRWTDANGREIASNSGEQQLLLHILINTPDVDNSTYTCDVQAVLAAGVGVNRDTVTLQVNTTVPPRPPVSVRTDSITSSSVLVEWEVRGVFISAESVQETFTIVVGTLPSRDVPATASLMYSIAITSLEPGTNYSYTVESRNTFGAVTSEVLRFKTDYAMARPGGVANLQSNPIDDSTLMISWDPPANPNGDILSYSVRVINLSDGSGVTVEREDLGTDFTLTGLVPGVPYNVSIAAVNRAGPGEFTVFINFTKQLPPTTAPRNVTVTRPSPTVMVVSWIPLSYSEARGFISHYTVAYSPMTNVRKGQSMSFLRTVPGMDTSTAIIEGLDPGTDYNVQVFATNGAETSPMSPAIVAQVSNSTEGAARNSSVAGIVGGTIVDVVLLLAALTVGVVLFVS